MSSDLEALAAAIVERARPGEDVEAFVTHEREFSVKAFNGEVESVSSAEPRGAGVRVVKSHRAGFAYTTELSEAGLDEVVERARDNSLHATADDAVGLAEAPSSKPPEEALDLVDESQDRVSPEQKVEFALQLERATRGFDSRVRVVEEAVYADSDTSVALATTTGIAGSYRRTDAWCYAVAIAEADGDTEVGFEFDLGRGLAALDAGEVAARSARRALGLLGAGKLPSARMPVLLDPYTAGQFLGTLGGVLTAEAVQKGRSLFAGKLGEKVASGVVTLVDDGRVPGAPGSAPWDAEGVSTSRTEVISGGTLTSYLYDTISARREGRTSSGNAARAGFKSPPRPSPTNLALEPTESRDRLLAQAGRALFVHDFHGVHSGVNPISGDFSVGATGYLLEDGARSRPVKEVTIAAPHPRDACRHRGGRRRPQMASLRRFLRGIHDAHRRDDGGGKLSASSHRTSSQNTTPATTT
jgi:PmbA protein